jgi:hypothetical protein
MRTSPASFTPSPLASPLIVSLAAVGPLIARSPVTSGSELSSRIVCGALKAAGSKLMTSAPAEALASRIA